jgi:hypothetical protein
VGHPDHPVAVVFFQNASQPPEPESFAADRPESDSTETTDENYVNDIMISTTGEEFVNYYYYYYYSYYYYFYYTGKPIPGSRK